MMTPKLILLVCTFASLTLSCTDRHISDDERAQVKQEMQRRKLKKLADTDILSFSLQQAASLADTSQKLLGNTLMQSIQEKGVAGAIEYCNLAAYPLVDSVANANGMSIKRVSLRIRNPNDAPDSYDQAMLEAYDYAIAAGTVPKEEIRFSDDKKFVLYARPIMITNAMCLNCHGVVGKDVMPEVHQKILELYPNDNATNHKLGDIRGMWSIKIPVQEVVKRM